MRLGWKRIIFLRAQPVDWRNVVRESIRIAAVGFLALIIFGLDLFVIPLGIATGSLYACLVFITGSLRDRRLPVFCAVVATSLTLLGGVGPTVPGVPIWMGIVNRILSVVVVWAAVFFLLQRRQAVRALEEAHSGLEQRVEERTSELAQVNKALVAEISERIETEVTLRTSEAALEYSQRALQRSQTELRALTALLLTAQDEERRRISRDLHDDVNQRLAMMVVELEAIEHTHPDIHAVMASRLRSLKDNLSELSEDVRHLAYQFHPSVLDDLGLQVALQRLVDDFATRTSIASTFRGPSATDAVPLAEATCLYRIAQEALSNAGKHANATAVDVELAYEEDRLALTIRDNGIGFHATQPNPERVGIGLVSMKERAHQVNGELAVESKVGRGTTVRATVPLVRARR